MIRKLAQFKVVARRRRRRRDADRQRPDRDRAEADARRRPRSTRSRASRKKPGASSAPRWTSSSSSAASSTASSPSSPRTSRNEDRLLWDAEIHFPGGQFQTLAREVEASLNYFGVLSKLEQYSQLKIWIGRFRMLPGRSDGEIDRREPDALQRVFHQLKTLSKQYEPGYIEAFRHDFHTDWAAMSPTPRSNCSQATEPPGAPRTTNSRRSNSRRATRSGSSGCASRARRRSTSSRRSMHRTALPDEGVDEFLAQLKQVVNGLGASDPSCSSW